MKMTKLNHNCQICNNENGEELGILNYKLFDDSLISGNFDIVSCNRCGFVFYNTSSMQIDYDNFYRESFYSTEYINRELTSDEINYIDKSINILSPYIKDKNISIMDVGCGNGVLLERLNKLGFTNLYGVDPSPSCVNIINKLLNKKAQLGTITNIPFDNIKVDIIILSHVLEHVIDLQLSLKNIDNKISKGGLIYVEVPDSTKYEEYGNPLRYFYLTHINYFDIVHLRDIFYSNGYQEVKSGHYTRIEGKLSMPCIWAIFRKNRDDWIDGRLAITYNLDLANRIKNWFNDNKYNKLDTNNILTDLALSDGKIYLWGLGIHTQMILGMSPLKDCIHRIYFIDNDKKVQKKILCGKIVRDIDTLKNATYKDVIIIGAPTHSKKMCDHLKKIGFRGKIVKIGFGNVKL